MSEEVGVRTEYVLSLIDREKIKPTSKKESTGF